MAEFQIRDVVAPIGKYKNRDGEEKNEYIKIGTARVSEHGSQIQLFIKSTPLNWDGRAYVNKPYEKKDSEQIDNEPIDLSQIPF